MPDHFATSLIMPQAFANPVTVAGVIVGETSLKIWGLTSPQRLQRQLARVGAHSDVASAHLQLLLRADWVYDEAIIRGMVRAGRELALVAADGQCVAAVIRPAGTARASAALLRGTAPDGLHPGTPAEMADGYNDVLRKREPPYLLPLTAQQLPAIEARVFAGAYKGVTDFVTLYVWPRPAREVTRWCANLGVTPNMVTSLGLVLVVLAMVAFWRGHYFWGLLAAWPMTFLDTVDGKLARVTLRSSPFGNVYDHSIDLIHPPLWWWAWIVGLAPAGLPLEQSGLVLMVIVAGYVAQRLEEGLFIAFFKMDMHVWQRFDSALRLVTARRNPNLVILTIATLFGRPDRGIVVVAVWVAICLLLHGLRLAQAALARRHGPLRSWLATSQQ
jgi:phosphatidylglycerophosphate synthase